MGGQRRRLLCIVSTLAIGGALMMLASSSGLGAASQASPSRTATRSSRRLLDAAEGEQKGRNLDRERRGEFKLLTSTFGPRKLLSESASSRTGPVRLFVFAQSASRFFPTSRSLASRPLSPAAAWSFEFCNLKFPSSLFEIPLFFFAKRRLCFSKTKKKTELKKTSKKNSPPPPLPLPPSLSRPAPPSNNKRQSRSPPPPPSSRASPGSTPTATSSRPTGARRCARRTAPTGGTARTSRARATSRSPAATGGSTPSASPPTGRATSSRGTAAPSWRWPPSKRSRTCTRRTAFWRGRR